MSTGNEDKQISSSFSHIQNAWLFHIAHGFAKITKNWSTPDISQSFQTADTDSPKGTWSTSEITSLIQFLSFPFNLHLIQTYALWFPVGSFHTSLSKFFSIQILESDQIKIVQNPLKCSGHFISEICNQQITHVNILVKHSCKINLNVRRALRK